MPVTQTNTSHPFFKLRDQLSSISFDPCIDTDINEIMAAREYADFYHLSFKKDICQKHCIGKFSAVGYDIVAQYWLPASGSPKATVFFLHGYFDHTGLFSHLVEFLLRQGWLVVLYDQPGHGLSSGEQACIGDFSEYVCVLQKYFQLADKLPRPWYGIAQSTGCAVYLHAFMQEQIDNPFAKTVLMAPLIRPANWNKGIWLYRLLSPLTRQIPRSFSQNSHDPVFIDLVCHRDPLQSRYLKTVWVGAMKKWLEGFAILGDIFLDGLVIQGEADDTVDWRYNVRLLKQKIRGLNYCLLPGASHHLANEREDLRRQVFEAIECFLQAPPFCEDKTAEII